MVQSLTSDQLTIIDPIAHPGWDTLIGSMPEHSFFHSSNWAAVLKESYSYRPLYFTRSEGAKQAKPSVVIPVMEVDSSLTGKRGVSIPFTDYCEPIASDEGGFASMFDEVLQYGRRAGWKYVELRGGEKHFNGAAPYRTFLRHVLKIHGGDEKLFQQASGATRRNIRTAKNSGIRVAVSDLESDLREYYRLHCLTRKRHGVPPQPWGFFRAIFGNAISKGKGFTVLGRHEGRAVAGAVYLHSGKKGIYKFGASDLRYQHLRANNLVMWEAIRWFSGNGFEELCFGRTEPENAGLVRFKTGWGTRKENLFYYRYDLNRSLFMQDSPQTGSSCNRVFKTSGNPESRIFKALPIPFLRLAGSLLYRHVG
jgi:hypothetical protein